MRKQITDPRRFDTGRQSLLNDASAQIAAATSDEHKRLSSRLSLRLAKILEQGDERSVREALASSPSSSACCALQDALEQALTPDRRVGGVNVQVFAIPVLFVVGGASSASINGVVPDAGEIRALFEAAGALGHCRNFGFSNTLTDLGSLENIPWPTLYAITHSEQWDGLEVLDLPPAAISVTANQENVHLRFLVGAALTPADAPGFVESAGDIGRWGMELTKLLGRQLGSQDVSLLAIPRPPRPIVHAVKEGWHEARELGFQLFLSNALRQARMRTGEPDVLITTCSDSSIRIRLSSPFDDLLDQTYVWPLAASDDFDNIANGIFALLDEARVERIEVESTIENVSDAKSARH
jgi:hypothetical protein